MFKKTNKLQVNRQTLRQLTRVEAVLIQGGLFSATDDSGGADTTVTCTEDDGEESHLKTRFVNNVFLGC